MERILPNAVHESILSASDLMTSLPAPMLVVIWIAVVAVIWFLYTFTRNSIRVSTAFFHTTRHRLVSSLGSLKTKIVCIFRRSVPRRKSKAVTNAPDIEFDDIDLAVLRLAAAQGPGLALSAPEVAKRLQMRPRKIQQHLDKLGNSKILEAALGSTDGFGNYRLTQYGAAFLTMLNRQSGTLST